MTISHIDSDQKNWIYLSLTGLWLIAFFLAIPLLKRTEKKAG